MKPVLAIALLVVAGSALAADTIDLKSEKSLMGADGMAWGERRYPDLTTFLAQNAQRACPNGFEKVREYAVPESGGWYLHFVVRCLTPPDAPVASAAQVPH